MPTPSPPKRGASFGKKATGSYENSNEEIEFNVDDNSPYANSFQQETDSENPFAPASPQTNPSNSPASTLKVSKKKKKGNNKLINPVPMN